jgi:hypothetical protein
VEDHHEDCRLYATEFKRLKSCEPIRTTVPGCAGMTGMIGVSPPADRVQQRVGAVVT